MKSALLFFCILAAINTSAQVSKVEFTARISDVANTMPDGKTDDEVKGLNVIEELMGKQITYMNDLVTTELNAYNVEWTKAVQDDSSASRAKRKAEANLASVRKNVSNSHKATQEIKKAEDALKKANDDVHAAHIAEEKAQKDKQKVDTDNAILTSEQKSASDIAAMKKQLSLLSKENISRMNRAILNALDDFNGTL